MSVKDKDFNIENESKHCGIIIEVINAYKHNCLDLGLDNVILVSRQKKSDEALLVLGYTLGKLSKLEEENDQLKRNNEALKNCLNRRDKEIENLKNKS